MEGGAGGVGAHANHADICCRKPGKWRRRQAGAASEVLAAPTPVCTYTLPLPPPRPPHLS